MAVGDRRVEPHIDICPAGPREISRGRPVPLELRQLAYSCACLSTAQDQSLPKPQYHRSCPVENCFFAKHSRSSYQRLVVYWYDWCMQTSSLSSVDFSLKHLGNHVGSLNLYRYNTVVLTHTSCLSTAVWVFECLGSFRCVKLIQLRTCCLECDVQ
jgi:hypothetical protein